jgi:hypothetical protein
MRSVSGGQRHIKGLKGSEKVIVLRAHAERFALGLCMYQQEVEHTLSALTCPALIFAFDNEFNLFDL